MSKQIRFTYSGGKQQYILLEMCFFMFWIYIYFHFFFSRLVIFGLKRCKQHKPCKQIEKHMPEIFEKNFMFVFLRNSDLFRMLKDIARNNWEEKKVCAVWEAENYYLFLRLMWGRMEFVCLVYSATGIGFKEPQYLYINAVKWYKLSYAYAVSTFQFWQKKNESVGCRNSRNISFFLKQTALYRLIQFTLKLACQRSLSLL